jgi:tetratricopeptide (TPR) repeat protein
MIELGVIIGGASLALSVGKYLGLVEDKLSLGVAQLAGSELDAGLRALRQAAASEQEQQFLLREARAYLNKAAGLETDLRLAATYVGIALCHAHLGDARNAENAISELTRIEIPAPSFLLKAGRIASELPPWVALLPLGELVVVSGNTAKVALNIRDKSIERLGQLKASARDLLKQSLQEGCENVFCVPGQRSQPML